MLNITIRSIRLVSGIQNQSSISIIFLVKKRKAERIKKDIGVENLKLRKTQNPKPGTMIPIRLFSSCIYYRETVHFQSVETIELLFSLKSPSSWKIAINGNYL